MTLVGTLVWGSGAIEKLTFENEDTNSRIMDSIYAKCMQYYLGIVLNQKLCTNLLDFEINWARMGQHKFTLILYFLKLIVRTKYIPSLRNTCHKLFHKI